jgi:hypothetical protein
LMGNSPLTSFPRKTPALRERNKIALQRSPRSLVEPVLWLELLRLEKDGSAFMDMHTCHSKGSLVISKVPRLIPWIHELTPAGISQFLYCMIFVRCRRPVAVMSRVQIWVGQLLIYSSSRAYLKPSLITAVCSHYHKAKIHHSRIASAQLLIASRQSPNSGNNGNFAATGSSSDQ